MAAADGAVDGVLVHHQAAVEQPGKTVLQDGSHRGAVPGVGAADRHPHGAAVLLGICSHAEARDLVPVGLDHEQSGHGPVHGGVQLLANVLLQRPDGTEHGRNVRLAVEQAVEECHDEAHVGGPSL